MIQLLRWFDKIKKSYVFPRFVNTEGGFFVLVAGYKYRASDAAKKVGLGVLSHVFHYIVLVQSCLVFMQSTWTKFTIWQHEISIKKIVLTTWDVSSLIIVVIIVIFFFFFLIKNFVNKYSKGFYLWNIFKKLLMENEEVTDIFDTFLYFL